MGKRALGGAQEEWGPSNDMMVPSGSCRRLFPDQGISPEEVAGEFRLGKEVIGVHSNLAGRGINVGLPVCVPRGPCLSCRPKFAPVPGSKQKVHGKGRRRGSFLPKPLREVQIKDQKCSAWTKGIFQAGENLRPWKMMQGGNRGNAVEMIGRQIPLSYVHHFEVDVRRPLGPRFRQFNHPRREIQGKHAIGSFREETREASRPAADIKGRVKSGGKVPEQKWMVVGIVIPAFVLEPGDPIEVRAQP